MLQGMPSSMNYIFSDILLASERLCDFHKTVFNNLKGLLTIWGLSSRILFGSPGKMGYFYPLAQFFHLPIPKIWKAHPNINYFSKKYIKQRMSPKSITALININFETLTGVRTFCHFQSSFSKLWLKSTLS